MILLYHKVSLESLTEWWVDVDNFYRQMCELQSKKVVYLDDYDPKDSNQVVITFDGVYENILNYAVPILERFGYPYELFITGGYIGKDNKFDVSEPNAKFASGENLIEMVNRGGRLQWHSNTHPDFKKLSQEKIKEELKIENKIRDLDKKGFRWFAYPYGNFNRQAIEMSKKSFRGALSCIQGNNSDVYRLNREIVNNNSSFKRSTIGVVIPSYNYGQFLTEAVESVLRQTRAVDQILISDDNSQDNTYEIALMLQKKYGERIKINKNKENLGIVRHFNKAVSLINTDYVCFLGADNRFVSDYIEKTARELDINESLGVVYTDFALFGPRAGVAYKEFPARWRGENKMENFYIINFPNFDSSSKKILKKKNFIHGSSMYRRKAFEEVGRYKEAGGPEDHHLFYRMIEHGWLAKRVERPLLEYRQHSKEQANTRLSHYSELALYKQTYNQNKLIIENLERDVLVLRKELQEIKASRTWQFLKIYQQIIFKFNKYRKSTLWERMAYEVLKKILPDFIKSFLFELYFKYIKFKISNYLNLSILKRISGYREKYDVIIFSIIPWHHKYQRPQHLASRFAKDGCRVFYIEPNFILVNNNHLTVVDIQSKVRLERVKEDVFSVNLVSYKNYFIYKDIVTDEVSRGYLEKSLESLLKSLNNRRVIFKIDMPFWWDIVKDLKYPVIYDCMDEHSGFSTHTNQILRLEDELIKKSSLVITSADKLYKKAQVKSKNVVMVRNACEFVHFNQISGKVKIFRKPLDMYNISGPIIGYYGAIADWMDFELIAYLALEKKNWSFVLIGNIDSRSEINKIKNLKNVYILGEKKYRELPNYLDYFDVFFTPFKINDLILATNPVKMYEIYATGKPSVWTPIPEVIKTGKLAYIAKDRQHFVLQLEKALKEKDFKLKKERIKYAQNNTWESRYKQLTGYIEKKFPLVSIIIVSFNTKEYLKLCIDSILKYSNWPNLEIIIVDNSSTDGTKELLSQISKSDERLKVILQRENLGFAKANNIGIKVSKGEYIILLNSDTVVTSDWIWNMLLHLKDKQVGLVGPLTNKIGNEAKISVSYKDEVDPKYLDIQKVQETARTLNINNLGKSFEINNLAFFCIAGKRSLWNEIGKLDERFGLGTFEDDDYCLRVKNKGYKLICVEDVFIHHFLGKTREKINNMNIIFDENKKKFEKKWKRKWISHKYR